jgi:DeoR/GlpR family transcriptional regulator of sugar metabolism
MVLTDLGALVSVSFEWKHSVWKRSDQGMIKIEREAAILALLAEREAISVRTLCGRWPSVSEVTIRRDLARLESQGKLRRTHGGAVRVTNAAISTDRTETGEAGVRAADALVLPPIAGRWAHTLREHARRASIPFFAESAPQDGGIYLGPDNRAAGRTLGQAAAAWQIRRRRRTADILLLSLEELPNTRARSRGFLEGFREAFPGTVRSHLVDGRGTFGHAYRLALDALQATPSIDVIFGVNDHSVLAGLEACRRLGIGEDRCLAFSVGGEGHALFEELAAGRALKACAALFPEAVGHLAIDAIAHRFAGGELPHAVETDFAIITTATLADFFQHDSGRWTLRPEVLGRLVGGRGFRASAATTGKSVGFILHYPAHDWYRNLAAAMQRRAEELGMRFWACTAEDKYAEEIRDVRQRIARAAAAQIQDGETVLLAAGRLCAPLAAAIRARGTFRTLTVITNSLIAEAALRGAGGIRVIITGGEVAPSHGALLGPSVAAHLAAVRADKAFLAVEGVSVAFGASCDDGALAEAARQIIAASRHVIVLADHSVLGMEAAARIAPISALHTVITDIGTLPAHRMALAGAGIRVIVSDDDDMPQEVHAAVA